MTGLAVRMTGVSHDYTRDGQTTRVLDGFDLDVPAGAAVALVGPSGSGKSTVLTLLAGLQRPAAGQILLGDHPVHAMTESDLLELRAGPVAVVMQEPGRTLLPYATVAGNLRFVRRWGRRPGRPPGMEPAELLERLGITALAGTVVAALSGGEQQRVAIAAALVHRPRLLLLDEPTNQLDTAHRDAGLRLLATIRDAIGATVVIATHDPAVAGSADRVIHVGDRPTGAGTRRNGRRPGTPARAAPPILEATGVAFSVGDRPVLSGVDLVAGAGDVVAVTGPSGSGKSCLLAVLAGLARPAAGSVRLAGRPLDGGDLAVRRSVGLVLQGHGLVPLLTVAENVEVALRSAAGRDTGRDVAAVAAAALARVGMAGFADRLVEDLSGGQRQRVAIARAVAGAPALIIADEPTGALDPALRDLVLDVLVEEAFRGAAVVVATHDPHATAVSTRIVRLG